MIRNTRCMGILQIEEGRTRLLKLFWLALLAFHSDRIGGIRHVQALSDFYSNVTLRANNGDLSAVIYLPKDLKPGERTYYVSSRFDWSSMIGSIQRKATNPVTGQSKIHTLYGTKQWRNPHDPYWAESGVGLAAEFGVGTDGANCHLMCGWNEQSEVTNGVLGYRDAKSGESFLKIGVGELIKGSCSTCDSAEDYKFNSPYRFARPPVWTLELDSHEGGDSHQSGIKSVKLSHKAVLGDGQHGYKLEKVITLHNDQLLLKHSLTNLGREAFSTAWYSHHFFSCDSRPVQKGYSADFDLSSKNGEYAEPYSWSWSTPIEEYADVFATNADEEDVAIDGIISDDDETVTRIEMFRGVESNVRIKAEFVKDEASKGTFSIRGCDTQITESIPEVGNGSSGIAMYAFNLYIESGTFSPEPQILLSLRPGETTTWTQQLDFEDHFPQDLLQKGAAAATPKSLLLQKLVAIPTTASNSTSSSIHRRYYGVGVVGSLFILLLVFGLLSFSSRTTYCRREQTRTRNGQSYFPVPDVTQHRDATII